jgi:hypothetical protein
VCERRELDRKPGRRGYTPVMNGRAPATTPTTASALRCLHCGYDLRGSPADRCPECGEPTALSRATPELSTRSPAWLKNVESGLAYRVLGSGGFTLGVGALILFAPSQFASDWVHASFLFWSLLCAAAIAIGNWWATTPDPSHDSSGRALRLRTMSRALGTAGAFWPALVGASLWTNPMTVEAWFLLGTCWLALVCNAVGALIQSRYVEAYIPGLDEKRPTMGVSLLVLMSPAVYVLLAVSIAGRYAILFFILLPIAAVLASARHMGTLTFARRAMRFAELREVAETRWSDAHSNLDRARHP